MLTVSIAINGQPIFTRTVVNKLSEVGRYVCDDGTFIEHDPTDGAVELAIKALRGIHQDPDKVIGDVLRDALDQPLTYPEKAIADLQRTKISRAFCTYGACDDIAHDHTTLEDGEGGTLAEAVPMICHQCGEPAHYDESIEDYQHDRPSAPDCFMIKKKVR